jgi:hypothetical protein
MLTGLVLKEHLLFFLQKSKISSEMWIEAQAFFSFNA